MASVKQRVIPVDKQRKLELFCHLLRRQRWPQVLVFAKTRKRVDELVTSLQYQEVSTAAIHGDIPQHARLAALSEAISLVCADEATQLAAIEALIGKMLARREVEGFEPKHRVPATGPNKRPPPVVDAKPSTPRAGKKKKKSATTGKPKSRAAAPRTTGKAGKPAPARRTRQA